MPSHAFHMAPLRLTSGDGSEFMVKQCEHPDANNTCEAGLGKQKESFLTKLKKYKSPRDPENQKQVMRTKDKASTKRAETKCKPKAKYKSMKQQCNLVQLPSCDELATHPGCTLAFTHTVHWIWPSKSNKIPATLTEKRKKTK